MVGWRGLVTYAGGLAAYFLRRHDGCGWVLMGVCVGSALDCARVGAERLSVVERRREEGRRDIYVCGLESSGDGCWGGWVSLDSWLPRGGAR